jgi:hypothetical protein
VKRAQAGKTASADLPRDAKRSENISFAQLRLICPAEISQKSLVALLQRRQRNWVCFVQTAELGVRSKAVGKSSSHELNVFSPMSDHYTGRVDSLVSSIAGWPSLHL